MEIYPSSTQGAVISVSFGGVESTEVGVYREDCGTEEPRDPCYYTYYALTPPAITAGVVDVLIEFETEAPETLQGDFTYLDRPIIDSVSPNSLSILPDDSPVTIIARGMSVHPGLKVFFGDHEGTVQRILDTYDELTCLPPPYPGGDFPLEVDVRVVNPEGDEGVVRNGFTYTRISPVIRFFSPSEISAWSTSKYVSIYADHIVRGYVGAYFGGIPGTAAQVATNPQYGNRFIFIKAPPHAPGTVDVTLVNGDGGTFTKRNAFTFAGTPSADYHSADVDHDFRISLSELLRVVQLYRAGEVHCDSDSEDGFALGPGDHACSPHASDHAPQDWRISLEEVMEAIEFYNQLCYQPCSGAPGTYCPPD